MARGRKQPGRNSLAAIFFSYARREGAFALRLASDLRNAGLKVWIDQLDILPGEHWDQSIESALKNCPAFLIILSPQSVQSQNVMDEVNYALVEAKKIIPIMHEACDPPFRLRRLQYIDFTMDYDAGLGACVKHLWLLFGNASSQVSSSKLQPKHATESAIRTQSAERLDGMRILWVDDRPSNIRFERKAFEELGAQVHLAIDTNDALLIVQEIPFDLVISDMGRPSGQRAGFTLLSKIREMGNKVPFIIYAGSNAPHHKEEAVRAGAIGCTNNPYDLIDMVLKASRQR
jgi:CheY-like chemotaxis protein